MKKPGYIICRYLDDRPHDGLEIRTTSDRQ
jgi:hypothetical protein